MTDDKKDEPPRFGVLHSTMGRFVNTIHEAVETEARKCGCGNERPCALHDVTHEMHTAFALLRSMSPEQRTRIFCWFCTACGNEWLPGTPPCQCKWSTIK